MGFIQQLRNWLGRNSAKSPLCTKSPLYIPSTPALPDLWTSVDFGHPKPQLHLLDSAPTSVLTELCDSYWNSFLDEDFETSCFRESRVSSRALDILATRGSEALRWARERLKHPGYDARAGSAWLIGELVSKDQLGYCREEVARELAALTTRPWDEDTKELAANSVAMEALSRIGGPICIEAMRQLLTSEEWDGDELQYFAATVLAEQLNEPFQDADDKVQAAKKWLADHP